MSKTVIEMAREAGLFTHKEIQPELQAFAELVRAAERDACAKLCEEIGEESDSFTRDILCSTAAAIRNRSNT